ncbi:hypothetical protein RFI_07116 [Reticulomyxa filosa]|uniref:AMP-dependent synthetase/ligase domain-containing protein n=1 Tax=Reticulomyxa filosa TaxID=46433 RepID=X6NVT6_RETFI|nr:hypothetical protein RFI_07116 [Reticulomyxa filosa]|eukprot:ETO30003.1 hypothetical protein RFI_07116 [Reticulomyxa filosa]
MIGCNDSSLIQDQVWQGVNKSNPIRRFLFSRAYNAKQAALEAGDFPPSFWEQLVFRRVKARFGGQIKACSSGSAPLSAQTARFLQACLCDLVGEGYGLTETSAGGTTCSHFDTRFGHVGTPLSCVVYVCVCVSDRHFFFLLQLLCYTFHTLKKKKKRTTDRPEPRGEIWLRGPNVFQGYFKEPEKSGEVLTGDGWFATGDVGKWCRDGKLQIIDRKKNIFKLAQGEYVRPEYVENVFKGSPFIANIFVHGDSTQTYVVAIIVPNFESLIEWASKKGIVPPKDKKDLLKSPLVETLIRNELERLSQQEKLNGFEKIKQFVLVAEDFTIENGLLTTTLKLKRHEAKLKYQKEIEYMYATPTPSKL